MQWISSNAHCRGSAIVVLCTTRYAVQDFKSPHQAKHSISLAMHARLKLESSRSAHIQVVKKENEAGTTGASDYISRHNFSYLQLFYSDSHKWGPSYHGEPKVTDCLPDQRQEQPKERVMDRCKQKLHGAASSRWT
jgi:hypothetical protein